jgi:hypothetical protein
MALFQFYLLSSWSGGMLEKEDHTSFKEGRDPLIIEHKRHNDGCHQMI